VRGDVGWEPGEASFEYFMESKKRICKEEIEMKRKNLAVQ
jgi:hypothetical protein